MRPITQPTDADEPRRLPKSFRLLQSAIALANECAQEMVANLDAPDLAATGDRIERVEEEKRVLAAAMEDHLQGALLEPFDPADLHGLSANIALLTHRTARALYFFGLLGAERAPANLRVLARHLADATAETVRIVEDLTSRRARELGERARSVRSLRDDAHLQAERIVAIAPSTQGTDVVLWRTVGEAIDVAMAQALAVADECLRLATKHD